MFRNFILGAAISLGVVTSAAAQEGGGNLALILGNFDYANMEDVTGQEDANRMSRALSDAGFEVLRNDNGTSIDMIGAARSFADKMDEADRVLIALFGHVVSDENGSYLLGVGAPETDLLQIGGRSISLNALQTLIQQRPGTAIMMVAGNRAQPTLGRGLVDGFGRQEVKQGVTLVRGRANTLSRVLIDGLLESGNSLRQALPDRPGLNVSGFVSDRVSFMGAGRGDEVSPDLGQLAYWNATRDIGSQEAYESYLERFPDGIFANEARVALEDLRLAPLRAAQAEESRLNLDRGARRDVQAVLTRLGHDTRGVDGIFGQGTRGAITAFQSVNGFDETGYLTEAQLSVLMARKSEFDAIDRQRANENQQRIASAWREARGKDTLDSYRAFLSEYPRSRFATEAENRIAAFEAEEREQSNVLRQLEERRRQQEQAREEAQPENRQALERERQLTPNRVIRLAIERQLARLGHDPGAVDGNIDGATRRAIRNFQDVRGLPVTGYLDASTIALMAL
ncbi:peptidoglycan-binding protein [Pseudaestuariivita sp.]|uniref:peptidoglycan-binding protein n=1 Tax=Pseudaestuariivita sp. TaxID=2211669 RepID=UPI0040599D81